MVKLGVWGLWSSSTPLASYPCWWFWHHDCCHCSSHQSFLLKSLGVGCTVPHHHNSVLAACSQLHICILHGETLRQRPILNSQCLGHHIDSFPSVSFLCLQGYNMGRKGIYGLHILSDNHFILFAQAGLSCSLSVLHHDCSPLHWQELGHPDICPWCHQGIYLPLFHDIYNMAYSGGS